MTARRVLVTGSRNWTDQSQIYRALYYEREANAHGGGLVIVHGACPTGADAIADRWGRQFYPGQVSVEAYPADWQHFGKAAGPMRNQRMVDLGADICLAFPFPESRGTRDCVERALAARIPVREYPGYPKVIVGEIEVAQ